MKWNIWVKLTMDKEEIELKERLKEIKKKEIQRRKEQQSYKRATIEEKHEEPTAIYISNLPKSIHEELLIEEFSKFGAIRKDQDGNTRCKLYRDSEGNVKGDALIVYSRKESIPIAMEMMNGYSLKGFSIKVETAKFDKSRKRTAEEINTQQKKIKIVPREEPTDGDFEKNYSQKQSQRLRTLKVTNILDIYQELSTGEIDDIKNEILDGCSALGIVEDIQLYPNLGEAKVVFKQEMDARECAKVMNGRYFDGRKLLAFMIDEENA